MAYSLAIVLIARIERAAIHGRTLQQVLPRQKKAAALWDAAALLLVR
ncbi:hypothetical protein [Rhodanobacter hydrolyticus]|uniref:Uncharacterized protein n=1 Tax=Rhodanobacter hydrolyticus TaxID=2250595 RepID=A0ABW8J5D3_9GAMM